MKLKTDERILTELGVTKEKAEELYGLIQHYKNNSQDTLGVLTHINNNLTGNDRAVALYIYGCMRYATEL